MKDRYRKYNESCTQNYARLDHPGYIGTMEQTRLDDISEMFLGKCKLDSS